MRYMLGTVICIDTINERPAAVLRATPIGPYDTFIAGRAHALRVTPVSNNTREFERVPGLNGRELGLRDLAVAGAGRCDAGHTNADLALRLLPWPPCATRRVPSLQPSHGLITAAPAASKGAVSRVATVNPLEAAMAAM